MGANIVILRREERFELPYSARRGFVNGCGFGQEGAEKADKDGNACFGGACEADRGIGCLGRWEDLVEGVYWHDELDSIARKAEA